MGEKWEGHTQSASHGEISIKHFLAGSTSFCQGLGDGATRGQKAQMVTKLGFVFWLS